MTNNPLSVAASDSCRFRRGQGGHLSLVDFVRPALRLQLLSPLQHFVCSKAKSHPTCQFRSLRQEKEHLKREIGRDRRRQSQRGWLEWLLRTGKLVPRVAAEKAALFDGLPMVLALQVRPEGDLARHLLRRGRVRARIPCARQAKPDDGSSRVETIDTTSSLGPGEGMVGCGRSRQTRHW